MIVVDTSALLALADAEDQWRGTVADYVGRGPAGPFVVPWVVIGELGYGLTTRLYPVQEAAFLRELGVGGWIMEPSTEQDLVRAGELVEKYGDWPLGTVDALIVAMAERLNVTTLFTLDRRHFGAIQPAHCERFEIVP